MRVFLSILEFFNSCKFIRCLLSGLIFGFLIFFSSISFGQNSLQTGLVAWYPFDGNASDMSGNGNHGTVNGASLSTDRHGLANKAYQFDGVDDYISGSNWLNGINEGSYSLWFKKLGNGILINTGSTEQFFSGNVIQTSVFDNRRGGPGTRYHYPNPVSPLHLGNWTMITVIWDSLNTVQLYINGRAFNAGSRVTDGGVTGNYQNFGIGARQNLNAGGTYSNFFTGSIDDIRIYNRALSNDEVSNLCRLESPNHFVEMNSTVDLEMIHVEPGTFTMGSPTSESGRNSDENSHNVTLSKGFYLGKYEVTQAQYEAVMSGITGDLNATPSNWSGNPNRPVDSVSYEDIQVCLVRLNELESNKTQNGWAYVLPTEAQWEYACRAGTSTRYSWGNSISATDANWDHGADPNRPVDVGSFYPMLLVFMICMEMFMNGLMTGMESIPIHR